MGDGSAITICRRRTTRTRRRPAVRQTRSCSASEGNASQGILTPMPLDVEARVIQNTRLSPDYNVITLAAPEIAAATKPGQFVMVRPGHGSDPLLRRPFSVFEIIRSNGRV